MRPVLFITCDPHLAEQNELEFGIAFDLASSALMDPYAWWSIAEPGPGDGAWRVIAACPRSGSLVSCECRAQANGDIRILRARRVTRDEARCYCRHRRRVLLRDLDGPGASGVRAVATPPHRHGADRRSVPATLQEAPSCLNPALP